MIRKTLKILLLHFQLTIISLWDKAELNVFLKMTNESIDSTDPPPPQSQANCTWKIQFHSWSLASVYRFP